MPNFHGLVMRGKPKIGDFLVVYQDGFMSWSPARPFLEGYTPLPDVTEKAQPGKPLASGL